MASNVNSLKIRVPAHRPAPPSAAAIGRIAGRLLEAISVVWGVLVTTLSALTPEAIRAELRQTAGEIENRADLSSRLRFVSEEAWDH